MKKIYEFLLWNNCSNNCTFCHQRAHERKIDDKILNSKEQIEALLKCKEQIEALLKCKEFLDTSFEQGNHILLVGGEIFDIQNKDVQKQLMWLLLRVIEKMTLNQIALLYLNTNLLYQNTDLLCWFLTMMKNNHLMNRLKFTTSYDMVGRFTSKERELLFYKNLKSIKDKYPEIHIVVNTVLTNEACKRIQEDTFGANYLLEYLKEQGKEHFTIKDWMDYFQVDINTIPYIKLSYDKAPEMPTKAEIFNTLLHIDSLIPGYLKSYADNIALTQEKDLYEYNKLKREYIYCSSALSDCGHSENFKLSFADSTDCFPCTIKKLVNHKL